MVNFNRGIKEVLLCEWGWPPVFHHVSPGERSQGSENQAEGEDGRLTSTRPCSIWHSGL